MDSIQIDLTSIVAIWMGGAILLVPLLGVVARWGLVPLLESLARLRGAGQPSALDPSLDDLRLRLDGVELQVADLARAVRRLEDAGAAHQGFHVGR